MPNQGNKSKGRSGIVQKKKKPTMPATDKQGAQSKASKDDVQQGDMGSSAKKESKTASGNGGNDG